MSAFGILRIRPPSPTSFGKRMSQPVSPSPGDPTGTRRAPPSATTAVRPRDRSRCATRAQNSTSSSSIWSGSKTVQRIGLVSGKAFGTTPHGHRHTYAQRLTDAGVGAPVIQSALHHKSPELQQVYEEPTADKVNGSPRGRECRQSKAAVMSPLSTGMRPLLWQIHAKA
jgi:integrase